MTENNPKTDRKAPPHGWRKGQSGNPGGRPKRTLQERELINACKAKTPTALKVLVELMQHADKDAVRLSAALAVIERGHGKPLDRHEIAARVEAANQQPINILQLAKEIAFTLALGDREQRKQAVPSPVQGPRFLPTTPRDVEDPQPVEPQPENDLQRRIDEEARAANEAARVQAAFDAKDNHHADLIREENQRRMATKHHDPLRPWLKP